MYFSVFVNDTDFILCLWEKLEFPLSVLYAVDFGSSAVTAFNLSKAFGKVEDMLEDLSGYLHTTKLYETKEEVREKLDELRVINASELAERIAEKKAEFSSQLEKTAANCRKLMKECVQNWKNAWMNLKKNISRFVKRPILLENER